jgi:hypothetical protein
MTSDLPHRLRIACSSESPLGRLCSEAADALEAARDDNLRLAGQLLRYKSDRQYILGFNDGWEAAGEAPAAPHGAEVAVDIANAPAFKPSIIEYPDAGHTEMLLEDCPTIVGQEMTVRPLKRMSDDPDKRDIVGFQWDSPYSKLDEPQHADNLRHGLQNVADSLKSRPPELRGPFVSSATKRGDEQ